MGTSLKEKICKLQGEKFTNLVIDDTSFKFSDLICQTRDEFFQKFAKSNIIDNAKEISFNSINSVVQEDSDSTIKINYKNSMGINANISFEFTDKSFNALLFEFLEGELRFNKTRERLTSLKASVQGLSFLLTVLALTYFFYDDAVEIENGVAGKPYGAWAKISRFVTEFLGPTGVLIIGGLLTALGVFILWSRITNPPYITKYTPATS